MNKTLPSPNVGSRLKQLKDYRLRQWMERLRRQRISVPKAYLKVSATGLLRLHPRFVRRMGFRVGDEITLKKDKDCVRLIRVLSPFEVKLNRLKQRISKKLEHVDF